MATFLGRLEVRGSKVYKHIVAIAQLNSRTVLLVAICCLIQISNHVKISPLFSLKYNL